MQFSTSKENQQRDTLLGLLIATRVLIAESVDHLNKLESTAPLTDSDFASLLLTHHGIHTTAYELSRFLNGRGNAGKK